MKLARRIITEFHSAEAARKAEEEFRRVFQQRQQPTEVEIRSLPVEQFLPYPALQRLLSQKPGATETPIKLDKLLADVGLVSSVSEAARKLREGAVSVKGQRCREPLYLLDARHTNELPLQVGRRYLTVILEGFKRPD
jgi:tyrosyl-tRNA synthetase